MSGHLVGCPQEADDRNEVCDCDSIRAAHDQGLQQFEIIIEKVPMDRNLEDHYDLTFRNSDEAWDFARSVARIPGFPSARVKSVTLKGEVRTRLPSHLNGYPVVAEAIKDVPFPNQESPSWMVMVRRLRHEAQEYVVATWHPSLGSQWLWGQYCKTFDEALEEFNSRRVVPVEATL